jgi:hypothetical protein
VDAAGEFCARSDNSIFGHAVAGGRGERQAPPDGLSPQQQLIWTRKMAEALGVKGVPLPASA